MVEFERCWLPRIGEGTADAHRERDISVSGDDMFEQALKASTIYICLKTI